MVKFVGTDPDTGRRTIGIGLSAGNMNKLLEGRPILFSLSELNLPWEADVFIFGGETEQDMQAALEHRIGPNTIRRIDPTLENPHGPKL